MRVILRIATRAYIYMFHGHMRACLTVSNVRCVSYIPECVYKCRLSVHMYLCTRKAVCQSGTPTARVQIPGRMLTGLVVFRPQFPYFYKGSNTRVV